LRLSSSFFFLASYSRFLRCSSNLRFFSSSSAFFLSSSYFRLISAADGCLVTGLGSSCLTFVSSFGLDD
jgi:hypothetical protein